LSASASKNFVKKNLKSREDLKKRDRPNWKQRKQQDWQLRPKKMVL
jgi:hypothetical protein